MSRNRKIVSSFLLALALGLAACQDDDGVGANGELGDRLSAPTTLTIVSPSQAGIAGRDETGAPVAVGPLVVDGGRISVAVDASGDIVVQDFVVELGDVLADQGRLAAAPRTLTDVRISLGRALVLHDAWSPSGESAHATVYGDLRLDWSMLDENGAALPLGGERIDEVAIDVSLRLDADGRVSARLVASLYGHVFGDWGVELTDFAMEVSASSK